MTSVTSALTVSPTSDLPARDLRRQAPRSPRVRLGGYVILARALDKGRAAIAGTLGDYHFGCPLDQQFLRFVGVEAEELREQLAAGKSDGDILTWLPTAARTPRTPAEIIGWCAFQEHRAPEDPASRAYFDEVKAADGPERSDIHSWFDLLDLDDDVSFGGRA